MEHSEKCLIPESTVYLKYIITGTKQCDTEDLREHIYKQKAKKYKTASHHAPHLDVADLGAVVCRIDLCDDRQGLEITGQTEITTGS